MQALAACGISRQIGGIMKHTETVMTEITANDAPTMIRMIHLILFGERDG